MLKLYHLKYLQKDFTIGNHTFSADTLETTPKIEPHWEKIKIDWRHQQEIEGGFCICTDGSKMSNRVCCAMVILTGHVAIAIYQSRFFNATRTENTLSSDVRTGTQSEENTFLKDTKHLRCHNYLQINNISINLPSVSSRFGSKCRGECLESDPSFSGSVDWGCYRNVDHLLSYAPRGGQDELILDISEMILNILSNTCYHVYSF
ncbi:hypothetical protein CDAR_299811 [Caerostris darwini]|uniref:Uncharacterized protein n=1 Tax=Caerostris darwini TaxID=1538125 RepID=A0AAV4UQJ6_9ARAC|nr:hypothetical protein CDAR_299811 [Caerostris darwini]